MVKKFNIRVYGLLINEYKEVLVSDEEEKGKRFIKFPGGGLEFGEGLIDGLKREFIEECAMEIEIIRHFYTTHFFAESIFNGHQLIAVYYLVKPVGDFIVSTSTVPYNFINPVGDTKQAFRFIALKDISEDDVTFLVDKHVVKLLKALPGF
ncbi:MAG: NUDIX domain-containing protein [Sphingobacteriales bacterium]|nr:MAG: NUDIX domain-containing protein [Sphingobacteriales bacterium]TAF80647.1 MAG: NUDIX domain-containing protein [Sphingobacteriales bacterium]